MLYQESSSLTSVQMKLLEKTLGWCFSQIKFGATPAGITGRGWIYMKSELSQAEKQIFPSVQWSLSFLRMMSLWMTCSVCDFTVPQKKKRSCESEWWCHWPGILCSLLLQGHHGNKCKIPNIMSVTTFNVSANRQTQHFTHLLCWQYYCLSTLFINMG